MEGRVLEVEALSTNSVNMWYVPSQGVTLNKGVNIFDTQQEALEHAHRYIDRIEKLMRRLRSDLNTQPLVNR